MRLGARLQAFGSFGLFLLLLCSSILGSPASAQNPAEPLTVAAVAPKAAGDLATTSAALAPSAAPPAQATPEQTLQNEVPLRVMVGKSVLINTSDRLRRVSVTDPAVADAIVVTPNQILVHGRAPGEVSLIIWDEMEHSRSFDLRVDVDVSAAAEEIKFIFPKDAITISASRSAIVLSGHVNSKEDAERAALIATAYSKNVVNVLTFGPAGVQEVLLEVKFAEIDRTAITQLGINILSTGAANTFGAISTGQFGGTTGASIGSASQPAGSTIVGGATGNGTAGAFGTNNVLNLFLFRRDINMGVMIEALQQQNVLQILAEPNLIAVDGKEANFLAGGEFPFPIVQGVGGAQSLTIQFKEYGIRLKFTPTFMSNGNIHLKVSPEVSALDFSNALSIQGTVIPALSTRKAETEFEIQDGQSFVIAGLLDNTLTNVMSKIPGLGDIPILGNLFKSKNLQREKTELMVLVTAHRISPSGQPSPLPAFPQKFLEKLPGEPKSAGGKG
ncbi:MAG: type II and III secretion system protein family protein [Terriglobales bacterium]